jgi:hypothetical protein
MEDDLNIFENGRKRNFFTGRRPQYLVNKTKQNHATTIQLNKKQ